MRRRYKAGFAMASAVLHACGNQPVVVRTVGPSTSSPAPTEATSTTEAPATTAVPTPTLAPEVEAPLASPLTTSGAGATVPAPPTTRRTTTTRAMAPEAASGACGGALPPCSVMRRESGGDPTAVNATGCGGRGCYGKWQADPRTSQAMGYPLTMDQYPESVQDEFAAALWQNGAGCAHWGACAA